MRLSSALALLAISLGAAPALAQSAPAAPAAPVPAARTAPRPVDLSSYTCQDMMQDMTDKQIERVGISLLVAYTITQVQADPSKLKFDMDSVRRLSERVGRNCGLGERSRTVLQVVGDEYKTLGKPE